MKRARSPLTLRVFPDAVLRDVSQPVERFDRSLGDLIDEMFELMHSHDGIGLAAPQLGMNLRLIVTGLSEARLAIVNPEVATEGDDSNEALEGCLSLPGTSVNVRRSSVVTVRGWTGRGQAVSLYAGGLLARVIQHEVDHLNGRLISDYAMEETPR